MVQIRMTTPRLLVLGVLLDDPARERYGLDLAKQAGLEPGTIYPILVAFEGAGWLTSREEDITDASTLGRPRRRYYLLSDAGAHAAREALTRAESRRTAPTVRKLAW